MENKGELAMHALVGFVGPFALLAQHAALGIWGGANPLHSTMCSR